jgi:hypothetical protein
VTPSSPRLPDFGLCEGLGFDPGRGRVVTRLEAPVVAGRPGLVEVGLIAQTVQVGPSARSMDQARNPRDDDQADRLKLGERRADGVSANAEHREAIEGDLQPPVVDAARPEKLMAYAKPSPQRVDADGSEGDGLRELKVDLDEAIRLIERLCPRLPHQEPLNG